MAHSLLLGGVTAGLHVRVSAPDGSTPPATCCATPKARADETGGSGRRWSPTRTRRSRAPTSSSPTPGSRWARRTTAATARPRSGPSGQRRAAGPGGARRDRAALPARAPRRRDHRRGARRPAQRGVGRGREPAARAEGAAGLAAGPGDGDEPPATPRAPPAGPDRRAVSRGRSAARRSCSPCWRPRASRPPRPPCRGTSTSSARSSCAAPTAACRSTSSRTTAARCAASRAAPAGWPGCSASCSCRPTRAGTSRCCARRRARRTTSPARWTAPRCTTSSAPSRATTPCSWWPASPMTGATLAAARSTNLKSAKHRLTTATKELRAMTDRVVLAYSGGLDTSVAHRLDRRGDRRGGRRRHRRPRPGRRGPRGRSASAHWPAARSRRSSPTPATSSPSEYCLPALQAHALYMDRYPLVSALSRPLIVKHLVDAARAVRRRDRRARLHRQGQRPGPVRGRHPGARPRAARCIAPVRDFAWTREKAIEYAEEHDLPIDTTKRSPYSIDQNVWGRAVETGFLEDLWNAPIEGRLRLHARTRRNRSEPDEVAITLRDGRPVAIDGAPRRRCCRRSRSSTRAAGATASAGSTWSRTGWSASRAARSTRRPARSRCSPRTRSWRAVTRRARPRPRFKRSVSQRWSELVVRRAVVLPAQGGARLVHRDEPGVRHRRGADDAARRPAPADRPALGRARCTTSAWPPTTRATRSTRASRRASCSCGACPARSRRAGRQRVAQ